MRTVAITMTSLALASCAPTPDSGGPPTNPADSLLAVCDAEAAQGMIGELASPEVGARLLAATGARQLRWAPPRSAMTMDYRTDRLTVEYDDDLAITRISCG